MARRRRRAPKPAYYKGNAEAEALMQKHGGVVDYPDCHLPDVVRVQWDAPAQISKLRTKNEVHGFHLGEHYKTVEDAQRACVLGMVPDVLWDTYREMRDKLTPMVEEFAAAMPTAKRSWHKRDFGDELDVDRWMAGDPICFDNIEPGADKQVIRFGVQNSFASEAKEELFIRTAALGAAASELLERLNYGVEIFAICIGSHENRGYFASSVKLKGSSEPLDPQNVLVAGMPAMLRVFTFGMAEAFRLWPDEVYPVTPDTDWAKLFDLHAFVGAHNCSVYSEEDEALGGFLKQAGTLLRTRK